MVELRVVGRLDLRDQRGAELRSVLTQPKRVGLLAYLILAQPRDFHRRDKLLALFWPELDESHARNALNQALRFLRRALGEEVLISRGADEVGIDLERLSCDSLTFETRIDGGQLDEALALYRGDLLEGFHADASTEFDSWLEAERTRLRTLARSAASQQSAAAEAAGELSGAIGWSRRALMIDPLDEQSLRRLVQLLDRSGDRAAAVRAYQEFASRLNRELELEPSPETRAVIESVRQRAETLLHVDAFEEAPVSSREQRSQRIRDTISEVHRRSIWQILGVYLGASWVGYQVVIDLTDGIGLPDWVPGFALVLFVIGLPVVVATAFVQHGPPILRKLTASPESEDLAQQPVMPFISSRNLLTWRRSVSGGVVAFALLAVATLLMRNVAFGPFSTLAAEGRLGAHDRIVLADFGSLTGDSTVAGVVTELLRIDLLQSNFVRLAEPALIRDALQRMKLDPQAGIPPDAARVLALREGYKAAFNGDVSRVGNSYLFTGQLLAAADGAVLLVLSEVADDSTQLIDAMERFAKKLRERSGESLKSLSASEPLSAVSTASLPALRKYSEAMRVQIQTGDELSVVALLEEATALDSTFAMAMRKAAQSYRNLGGGYRDQLVLRARQAYNLRDRLPEKERYLAQATFYDLVAGDQTRAIAAYRSVLELDPDDYVTTNNLAQLLINEGDLAGAEKLLRRGVDLYGTQFHFINLIDVQFRLGRPADARATLERALQKLPGNENVEYRRVLLLQAEGKYDQAEVAAQEHLRRFERNRGGRLRALTALGHIAAVRGHLRAARQYVAQREAAAAEENNLVVRLQARMQLIWTTLALVGDTASAIAQVDSAMRDLMDRIPGVNRPWFAVVDLLLNARALDRTQVLLDEWARLVPPDERGRNGEEALRCFHEELGFERRPSINTLPQFQRTQPGSGLCGGTRDLGERYDRLGQRDSAIANYEQFINTPGLGRTEGAARWLHATYLRLGQLYEARGDSTRSADYYNRFVTLWKDADPELQPRVAAVQRRLAELQPKRP